MTVSMSTRTKQRDLDLYPDDLGPLVGDLDGDITLLMDEFAAGEIDANEWRDRFAAMLAGAIALAYFVGMGGTVITADQRATMDAMLAEQLAYLNRFYEAVAQTFEAGGEFDPAWRSRASMYADAVTEPFWEARTWPWPLPAYPGDGTSQCLTHCRCDWVIQVIDEAAGDADAFWMLGPVEHCQTCIERATRWNPLQIRGWRLPLYDVINKDDARALEKLSARLAQMASAVALKHLRGKHDQQSHGRRGASSDIIVGYELDEDQADAIGKYTGELYDNINSALRSGKTPSGEISDAISAIDVSFGKVAKSTTVYRGLDATHLNRLKPGDKFAERGYSSASSDYRIAQGRADKGFKVVMEVRLKRGQEAMKIPGRESEILLPRGSQFRFVKEKWMPEPGGGGHYSWIVDLLNPVYKTTTKHLAGRHDQSTHGKWSGDAEGGQPPKPTAAQLSARARAKRQRDARREAAQQASAGDIEFAMARSVMAREASAYMNRMSHPNYLAARASHDEVMARAINSKHRYEDAEKAYNDARKPYDDKLNALYDRERKQTDLANKARAKGDYRAEDRHLSARYETRRRASKLEQERSDKTAQLLHEAALAESQWKNVDSQDLASAINQFDFVRIGYEQAAAMYIANTKAARAIIMKHYVAEAQEVRVRLDKKIDQLGGDYENKRASINAQLDKYRDEYKVASEAHDWARTAEINKATLALHDQRTSLYEERNKAVAGAIRDAFRVSSSSDLHAHADVRGEFNGETHALIEKSLDEVGQYTGNNKFLTERGVRVIKYNGRAYSSRESVVAVPDNTFDGDGHVQMATHHEMGHILEGSDPGIRATTWDFYNGRTNGNKLVPVWGSPIIIGGRDFTEYCRPDRFLDRYMGKTYKNYNESGVSYTNESFGEIISMGLGYLSENPAKLLEDPDYFDFLYGVLRINE